MTTRTATQIMTRKVVTLSAKLDICGATQALFKHRVSGAPVVDANGRLVGILCEKDCLKVLAAEAFDGLPEGRLQDYMIRDVETVAPTASLFDIVQIFLKNPYHRLPVVDDQRQVIGQINRRDVFAAIESIRDNSYLYGSRDEHPTDEGGVDTAMRVARDRR